MEQSLEEFAHIITDTLIGSYTSCYNPILQYDDCVRINSCLVYVDLVAPDSSKQSDLVLHCSELTQ